MISVNKTDNLYHLQPLFDRLKWPRHLWDLACNKNVSDLVRGNITGMVAAEIAIT